MEREAPLATWPEGGDLVAAIAAQVRSLGTVFRLPAMRPTYVLSGAEGMRVMNDLACVERTPEVMPPEALHLLFNDGVGPVSSADGPEHARRLGAWWAPGGLDRAGVAQAYPRLERSVEDILDGWARRGIFSLPLEVQRATWRLASLLVLGSEQVGQRFVDMDIKTRSSVPAERAAAKERMLAWLDAEAARFEQTGAPTADACLGARLGASGQLSRVELVNELNHGLTAGMFGCLPITGLFRRISVDRALFDAVREEHRALQGDRSLRSMARTPLLTSLIEDALRSTTPVPLLYARARTTFHVDGVAIPEGAVVLGAAHATNQDATFHAGRGADHAPDPAKNIAFGIGRHLCPAADLSTVMIWTFASRLIATYDLRLLHEGDAPGQSAAGGFVRFGRGILDPADGPRAPHAPTIPATPLADRAPRHAVWPDTSFAIVGAGITGLTLAHELRKQGVRHVTVFERAPWVGGKADTVHIDGRPYNLGAHLCHGDLGVAGLAAEVGVGMERSTSYVLWDLDTNRAVPRRYKEMAEFNKLRRRLGAQPELAHAVGFADAEAHTYAAVDRWLGVHDLDALREVGPFFTGAGYGFMDEDVPAGYFLKFAQHMSDDGWTPAGGYKHLLERVADGLDVRCGTEVVDIRRSDEATGSVTISTRASDDAAAAVRTDTFDRLILTGPLEHTSPFLDASDEETALFSRIRSDDYYTVIATVDTDTPHPAGLYIVPANTASRGAGGRLTAFMRRYDDSNVYHFFCYGEPDQTEASVLERVRADVDKLGGALGEVHVFRKWAYAPRVSPHDMALGYHRRLARLQGHRNTFYAGSLLAFELTDHNVLFAKDLARTIVQGELDGATPGQVPATLPQVAPASDAERVDLLCRVPERGTASILEILRERYERTPDAVVTTFLDAKGKVVRSLTFRTLVDRAMATAVALQDAGLKPGDRVALVYPPDTDEFLIGFFGCLFARAIAVPVASPDPRTLDVEIPRFAHLMRDCACRFALTTRLYYAAALVGRAWHTLKRRGAASEAKWPSLTWIRTDGLSPLPPTARSPIPTPSADTVAYLQYTSGSTSAPKGVMINHGNILHNVEAIRRQAGMSVRSVLVGWVPLFHDMGLVGGPLNTIYTGAHLVFFSPMSFLQRPRLWIDAMHAYRATHTESPNFGYEFLLRHLEGASLDGIDLSSLTHALFGGEAMRHRTFERLAERLHETGFRASSMRNIYGAAEATLFLAGGGDGDPPILSVATGPLQAERRAVPCTPTTFSGTVLIGCRVPPDACDLRVVDENTCRLLPDGAVGEIWLSSPSVAQGYWGRTAADNDAIFRARIAGDDAPLQTYLRTGDLGFIDDGVVYICGRHKEMMIFEGRNFYPMDLEVTAMGAHPGIRQGCVVAFAVEEGDAEHLVIVAELKGTDTARAAEAASAIAVSMATQHRLSCKAVVMVRRGSLPKTSSGKLQRLKTRDAFLARQLAVIHEQGDGHAHGVLAVDDPTDPPADDLTQPPFCKDLAQTRRWLQRLIAAPLQVSPDEVGTDIPLANLGVGSLQALSMVVQMSAWIGEELSPSTLFEHQTIDALAGYLCGVAPITRRVLVPLQVGDPSLARTLFCVHPVGGSAMAYLGLVSQLPPQVPVYAFDSDGSDVPCDDLVEMARRYVAELQAVQPEGPYQLVGYSFGGTVAFEMARQMEAAGLALERLLMIDAPAPLYDEAAPGPQTQDTEAYANFLASAMLNRIISDELDDAAQQRLRERIELNHAAHARYRIPPHGPGPQAITFFRAAEEAPNLRDHLQHPGFDQPDFGWLQVSPGTDVRVITVPGDHFSVMNEPVVLANHVAQAIAAI